MFDYQRVSGSTPAAQRQNMEGSVRGSGSVEFSERFAPDSSTLY